MKHGYLCVLVVALAFLCYADLVGSVELEEVAPSHAMNAMDAEPKIAKPKESGKVGEAAGKTGEREDAAKAKAGKADKAAKATKAAKQLLGDEAPAPAVAPYSPAADYGDDEDPHSWKTLGEAMGFPGPFSGTSYSSENTAGYTVHHNHYVDIDDATKRIDCSGDSLDGQAQAYEPGVKDDKGKLGPTNLQTPRDLCNRCKGCTGFVDMHQENMAYFVQDPTVLKVQFGGASLDIYKRYWNKAKTYAMCKEGYKSLDDAARCDPCDSGSYSKQANLGTGCQECGTGRYNATAGAEECKECEPGKRSEFPTGSKKCITCDSKSYAQSGFTECMGCPAGTRGNQDGQVGTGDSGNDDECRQCEAGKWAYNRDGDGVLECSSCQPGFYSETASSTCTSCAKGKHTNTAEMTVCTNCVPGKYAKAGWAECKLCWPGVYSLEMASRCQKCELAKHFDGDGASTCKGCVAGYFADEKGLADCKACAKGQWSDADANKCTDCAMAKEAPEVGTVACSDCAAGKYASASATVECSSCATGQYQDQVESKDCKNCDVGTYMDKQGEPAGCKACAAGTYTAAVRTVTCTNCEAGWQQEATKTTVCKECVVGKFSSPGLANCDNCIAGKYTAAVGQANDCPKCVKAYWSNAGSTACTACVSGKENAEGDGDVSTCTNCDAGQYSSSGFVCQACPTATFADVAGQADSCKDCAAGKWENAEGSIACKECADGHFSGAKQAKCTACGDGTFAVGGSASCTNCATGKWAKGQVGSCSDCSSGQHAPGVKSSECTPCDKGTFQDQTAQSTCPTCAAGKFAKDKGTSLCTDCDVGYYSGAQAASCTACAAQTYSDVAGSTGCTACAANHVAGPAMTHCLECPPGRSAPGGEEELGEILDPIIEQYCRDCPAGREGDPAGPNCIDCKPGYFATESDSACSPCEVGKWAGLKYAACSACPGGKYSAGTTDDEPAENCKTCPNGQSMPASKAKKDVCDTCDKGRVSSPANPPHTACVDCGTGKYRGFDTYVCKECDAGMYNDDAQAETCKDCTSGKTSNSYPNKGQAACSNCAVGTYSVNPRNGCLFCPYGRSSAGGTSECADCGQYQVAAGNEACKNCPNGHEPHSSRHKCDKCPEAKKKSGGDNMCVNCPKGHRSINARDSCTACARGYYTTHKKYCDACPHTKYTSGSASDVCTYCGAGSYAVDVHNRRGHTANVGCKTCNSGWYVPAGGSNCIRCGRGHYQNQNNQNNCKQCPAGKFNPHGGPNKVCYDCGIRDDMVAPPGSTWCHRCNYRQEASSDRGYCKDCKSGQWKLNEYYPRYLGSWWWWRKIYGEHWIYKDRRWKLTGPNKCTNCPLGHWVWNRGWGHIWHPGLWCVRCSPGWYNDVPARSCKHCWNNKYVVQQWNNNDRQHNPVECRDCPSGWWSPRGSQNIRYCSPRCYYWSRWGPPSTGWRSRYVHGMWGWWWYRIPWDHYLWRVCSFGYGGGGWSCWFNRNYKGGGLWASRGEWSCWSARQHCNKRSAQVWGVGPYQACSGVYSDSSTFLWWGGWRRTTCHLMYNYNGWTRHHFPSLRPRCNRYSPWANRIRWHWWWWWRWYDPYCEHDTWNVFAGGRTYVKSGGWGWCWHRL